MALLFLDSFEYYSPEQSNRIYTGGGFGRAMPGRTGLYCGTGGANLTLGAEYSTICMGGAWNLNSTAQQGLFLNAGNIVRGSYFGIANLGDGRIYASAQIFGSATSSAPSTFVFHSSQWYYIEMYAQASAVFVPADPPLIPQSYIYVQYTYDVHVNEHSILSGILNTPHLPTTDSSLGHYNFIDLFVGGDALKDDVYVTDGEFLGDIAVVSLYPNGDITTDFTPSSGSGTPHYQNVLDHPAADDDATYNASDTVDQIDTYAMTDLVPFIGTIKGTQAMWLTRKTDAGSAACIAQYNGGAHNTSVQYPNETYLYIIDPQRHNPQTSADWTQGDVNALQLGLKRVAP